MKLTHAILIVMINYYTKYGKIKHEKSYNLQFYIYRSFLIQFFVIGQKWTVDVILIFVFISEFIIFLVIQYFSYIENGNKLANNINNVGKKVTLSLWDGFYIHKGKS